MSKKFWTIDGKYAVIVKAESGFNGIRNGYYENFEEILFTKKFVRLSEKNDWISERCTKLGSRKDNLKNSKKF